jgi:hypothetical protein
MLSLSEFNAFIEYTAFGIAGSAILMFIPLVRVWWAGRAPFSEPGFIGLRVAEMVLYCFGMMTIVNAGHTSEDGPPPAALMSLVVVNAFAWILDGSACFCDRMRPQVSRRAVLQWLGLVRVCANGFQGMTVSAMFGWSAPACLVASATIVNSMWWMCAGTQAPPRPRLSADDAARLEHSMANAGYERPPSEAPAAALLLDVAAPSARREQTA